MRSKNVCFSYGQYFLSWKFLPAGFYRFCWAEVEDGTSGCGIVPAKIKWLGVCWLNECVQTKRTEYPK